MNKVILVIDDDPGMVTLLRESITELGYTVEHAYDGELGLQKALSGTFALVVVDISLPKLGGFEICRTLRTKDEAMPILMLSSRTDEVDRVLGLELGADDYITKPFSVRELLARIRSLLRRSQLLENRGDSEVPQQPLVVHELTIDFVKRRVFRGEEQLELTALEFELLSFMAQRAGEPITREQLMDEVWGYQASSFEPTITTHLSRLRRKIEVDAANPVYIQTVRGVGYRFTDGSK